MMSDGGIISDDSSANLVDQGGDSPTTISPEEKLFARGAPPPTPYLVGAVVVAKGQELLRGLLPLRPSSSQSLLIAGGCDSDDMMSDGIISDDSSPNVVD